MERNRRTMSPARLRMTHEGAFERPEGMIYSQWDDSMIVDPFDIPDDWPRSAAIDFGFNHPTAAVWCAINPDGVYYLYREYRRAETLLVQHFEAISSLSQKEPSSYLWYADPSAKQGIAELRRLGLPLVPANNEVQAGIDTLSTLMATRRFKVFRGCKAWLDEVEGYVWDKKDDLPTDKPLKANDDLMDATRYLVHSQEKRLGVRLYT